MAESGAPPDPHATAPQPLPLLQRGSPLVRWLIGGLVCFAVVASIGGTIAATAGNLPDVEWRLDGGWLVLAAAGFLALNLIHASLWQMVLHRLGTPVGFARGLAVWCTSGLARYTPGTVLYSMLRVAMVQADGVTLRAGLASVVYELALTVTSAVIVGAYAIVHGDPLDVGVLRYAILTIPVIAVATLHPRVFRPVTDMALRRVGRPPLPTMLGVRALAQLTALYCLSWILAGLSLYALIQGLQTNSPDDLLIVLAAPAVGLVAAAVGFMIPGGLGARETGVAAVLNLAMPFTVALAAAVVLRLLQLGIEMVCAAVTSLVAEWLARRADAART